MLNKLYIKNYILISELEISFEKGFTTITGETGAGKSILIGALSLITGQRADTNVLLDKDKKCIIEAYFDIKNYGLSKIFDDNDLDYEDLTIIRREINAKGKSRVFVNDTPVSLSVLKQIGAKLIDIHSQHNNIFLNNPAFYREIVDLFAGIDEQTKSYKIIFDDYKNKQKQLFELEQTIKQSKQDLDYYQFRYNQIEEANLQEGEEEEIENELKKLNNAEEIKKSLLLSNEILLNSDENIIQALKSVENNLDNVSKAGLDAEEYKNRISSVIVELQDISYDLDRLNDSIEFNQEKIEELNERINLIYDLHQKFGVSNNAELLKIKDELNNKLSNFAIDETKYKELSEEINLIEKKLLKKAEQISKNRKKVKPEIEKEIRKMLVSLGIRNAVFEIEIKSSQQLLSDGIDKINFLFSANKNVPVSEISKSASGGEISRIMLSLKSLMAKQKMLPTIIFDEIDTGVSGEIAAKMAEIMKQLSETTQVISITHLPQIAAKGDSHFVVYKDDTKEKSQTKIIKLDENNRIKELAKMLSGKELTSAAMENAKELLQN